MALNGYSICAVDINRRKIMNEKKGYEINKILVELDNKEITVSMATGKILSAIDLMAHDAVLADVLALIMDDYNSLVKENLSQKATGLYRAVNIIEQYRRKHFS